MADVVDRIAPAKAPAKLEEHHSPNTVARGHINVLRRAINDTPEDEDDVHEALNGLLKHFDMPSLPDLGEEDNTVPCDEPELEEALARARLGEFTDCVIHLGRALPRKFMGIADALERHLERSR